MYKQTNLVTLQYINISGCRHCLLLACFMYKSAFADKSDIQNCCNSYLYDYNKIEDIPDFSLYNIITTIIKKYEKTPYFARIQIFTKQKRLLATTAQVKIAQTSEDIIIVCKKVLDKFIIHTWLINCLDIIKFPKSQRQ